MRISKSTLSRKNWIIIPHHTVSFHLIVFIYWSHPCLHSSKLILQLASILRIILKGGIVRVTRKMFPLWLTHIFLNYYSLEDFFAGPPDLSVIVTQRDEDVSKGWKKFAHKVGQNGNRLLSAAQSEPDEKNLFLKFRLKSNPRPHERRLEKFTTFKLRRFF